MAQSTLHAEREKDEMVKENGTYKEFLVKKRTTRDIPTFGDIPNYVVRLRRDEEENAVAEGNVTEVKSIEAPSSKSPPKDEEVEDEKKNAESEENEVIEKDKKAKNATKTVAEEAAEKKKAAEEEKARQKRRNESSIEKATKHLSTKG